ncbi:MAG: chemotaxis protein CheW [Gemmatimonadota bacterium]
MMPPAAVTPSATRRAQAGKYLTFFLANEEYGLEILKVHEIIGMLPITRVPRTPLFVRGLINLRGKVIPIIDLRQRFGMSREGAEDSCVIVVQVHGTQLGVVVDKVSEVLSIAEADIEPTPSFGVDVSTEYLLGLAKSDGKVRLLLDIDRVLTASEFDSVQAVAGVEG